jgi:hypothetical protein
MPAKSCWEQRDKPFTSREQQPELGLKPRKNHGKATIFRFSRRDFDFVGLAVVAAVKCAAQEIQRSISFFGFKICRGPRGLCPIEKLECVVPPPDLVFATMAGEEMGRIPRDKISEVLVDETAIFRVPSKGANKL